jgi:hypothetical protein
MQQLTSSLTSEAQSINQGTEYFKKWTTDEIGLFDPNVDDEDSVINMSRHVFYKNIYAFVNRLKDMTNIRDDDKLRSVLSQCFREAALIWHFTELFDMKKNLLRQINLSSWYQVMINRFKKRTFLTLFALQNFKYILIDARSGKDSRLFAQQIFRSVKAVNMNSVHNQLTIAWNNLDWRFRANIFELTTITFIRKFLNQLNFMSDIWQEMTRSQSQDQFKFMRGRFQNPRRTQDYSEYFVRSNPSLFSYQYQGAYSNYQPDNRQYERLEYRNRDTRSYNSRDNRSVDSRYFKEKSSESASVLSFTRQSLQITGENANQSASDSSYSEIKSKDNRNYKKKSRAYVTEEDEHENEMNNSFDDEYYHESNSELNYYNSEQNQEKKSKVNFSTSAQIFTCKKCKRIFLSNNRLHGHLRQDLCRQVKFKAHVDTTDHKILNESTVNFVMNILIVESSVDFFKNIETRFGFRDWIYVKVMISLSIKNSETQICLDTDCSVTLTDRNFIKMHEAHYSIRRMIISLNVRELEINKHEIWEYIIAIMYFLGKINQDKFIREVIRREVHLMNDLKVNMLISNDILRPEGIFIDEVNVKVIIASCQHMIISIEIRTLTKEMINKVLHARSITIISSYSMTIISIHRSNLSSDRNFLFESADLIISMYAHTLNDFINGVMIKNEFSKSIKILRNARLETITEILYLNVFHVDFSDVSHVDVQSYVERKSALTHKESWFKRVLKTAMIAYTAVVAVFFFTSQNTKNPNVVLSNDVIVHDFTSQTVSAFFDLINQYFNLWKSEEFVKLSKDQWMRISLKSDWEIRISEKIKIYSLETENKKLVDQIFDDLHAKKRLKYTTESTSFSYSVFVVWKSVNGKKKERVVVDIRGFNVITLSDAYSLSLQKNIIAAVKKCQYLFVIDCAFFFYQWRIHSEDRHKLIVVSHRDQKTFQVAVMRYKNSSAYVQRQVDRLFRDLIFVKIFIDDIIIFFKDLASHLTHLRKMFFILITNEIFVNSKKVFLRYEFVQLLDQRIDSLELSTDEEKLKAIFKLKFSRTLKQLKTYLDLIDWMRRYVSHYSTVFQSLQDRKTLLLKNSSIAESIRRKFSAFTRLLNSTSAEKIAFEFIQNSLFRSRHLIHVDIEKQLYEDIDVSKKFEIDVMIYHVEDEETEEYSSRSNIRLILFLSRQLNSVEKNYWFTELKIAGIVFTIRKIRHMIESFKKLTILFTDHESALRIVKQTSLIISFIDRLNLRLIRVFEYIQRFNIIIKHKSGKQHIVSDALSRLISENDEFASDSEELDALFIIILIEMKSSFKFKIIHEYSTDLKWKKILHTLVKNPVIKLSFKLNDDLIYRTDQVFIKHAYEFRRLCISFNIISDILHIAHSDNHSGFVKCFNIVFSSWYIHDLFKHLREYLRHCSQCQIFQTRRHKSYDALQSILISNVLFHTITIDFILALSRFIPNNFDTVMFTICKFSKRITLIPENVTWSAKQWALVLLERLELMNWGLSKTIISNRDSKFLIELWKTIFDRLDVKLLYSIVYHPQTDEQSKRTNQSVEIVLRYHLIISIKNWSSHLFIIQFYMNNSTFTTTEKSSNEIVYGFISVNSLDMTKDIIAFDSIRIRKKIANILAWTQMQMKSQYDRKHQYLNMRIDDYALLRLHKEYNISATKILEKKLSQQYADLFRILKKVRNLAYRLKISNHWRIHSVIFVTQLESMSNPIKDSYSRSRPKESGPVKMKEDTVKIKFYEIDRLIDRRITARRETEYLVRWKGWESQYDEWRNISELQGCLELVNEYEKFMNNLIILSDRLSRLNSQINTLNSSTFSDSRTSRKLTTSSSRTSTVNSFNDQVIGTRRSIRKRKSSRERDDIF